MSTELEHDIVQLSAWIAAPMFRKEIAFDTFIFGDFKTTSETRDIHV